jgi:hypothetical protein
VAQAWYKYSSFPMRIYELMKVSVNIQVAVVLTAAVV